MAWLKPEHSGWMSVNAPCFRVIKPLDLDASPCFKPPMPDYRRFSIVRNNLKYFASWYLDGDLAHVVGAYGSKSEKVAPGKSVEAATKAMLAEMVEAWWVKVRAELPEDNALPRNVLATADDIMINFRRGDELFTSQRIVSIEGDKAFADIPAGGEEIGAARVEIDPDAAAEFHSDESLRTGSWMYSSDFVLAD